MSSKPYKEKKYENKSAETSRRCQTYRDIRDLIECKNIVQHEQIIDSLPKKGSRGICFRLEV